MTRSAETSAATSGPAAGGRAATVLIVDDEAQNRKLLQALLLPEGHVTQVAATGEEALASIAMHQPDLILLDVMMPGMNGYEVARTLKANPATSSIPIIMVTAYDDRNARLAGLNAGAEDFLAKPVDRAELWLRVRNLLRLKTLSDYLQRHNQILEQQVQARVADLHLFRNALDATVDGIFLLSRGSMRFVEVNATACNMLGYTREELLEIDPTQLIPATPEQLASAYDAVIAGGGTNELTQIPFRREDGSQFPAEVRRHAYKAGADWIIVSVVRDITERKRNEEQQRAAALYARGLIESSLDPLVTISAEGKITDVNRMTEVDTGIARTALIGADFADYFTEPERARAVYLKVLEQGYVRDYPLTIRHRDGHTTEVLYNATVYHDENGEARGVFAAARDITALKAAETNIQRYTEQLKTAFMSTVEVATIISEMRDPYTVGHERRVAEIAVAIGADLGFDERGQEGLRVAGYLHDVGKMTIPAEILSKPGKLSKIEFELIKGHARASYDVLKNVQFPWQVAEVALQHHERIDGSGYPQGLKGDAILLEARILAVADVVEAMSSHRPYRPGLGIDVALAEIERGRGTAYDPSVADACLKLFREENRALPF